MRWLPSPGLSLCGTFFTSSFALNGQLGSWGCGHRLVRSSKFRKLGFIDYNGGLEVHISLLNMVLHETSGITKGSDGE
jgi:hypothetical protein